MSAKEENTLDLAIDILLDVIEQACGTRGGELDSMCISTYAEAIRFLAAHGRLKIELDAGRRVIARKV